MTGASCTKYDYSGATELAWLILVQEETLECGRPLVQAGTLTGGPERRVRHGDAADERGRGCGAQAASRAGQSKACRMAGLLRYKIWRIHRLSMVIQR